MVTTATRAFLVLALAAGLSCGGTTEQSEPTTPDPAPGDGAGTPSDPEPTPAETVGWGSMDRDARIAVMREQVVPELGEMFRTFDADEFATFACATCHGEDFTDVEFRMPNGLHPLVPAQIPTLAESDDEETATYAQFMFGDVTPNMVRILGVQPFDPATGEGFGCLNCHATADAATE